MLKIYLMLLLLISLPCQAYPSSILKDSELRAIYLADQADRQPEVLQREREKVIQRDRARLQQVTKLLHAGRIKRAQDYWYAAIIFQHGHTTEEYRIAYSLAQLASVLNPDSTTAQWLKAATWDRLMLSMNQPQWYGTQYEISPQGHWSLSPIKLEMVTDEERLRAGIVLEKVRADLDVKNKKILQPQ